MVRFVLPRVYKCTSMLNPAIEDVKELSIFMCYEQDSVTANEVIIKEWIAWMDQDFMSIFGGFTILDTLYFILV